MQRFPTTERESSTPHREVIRATCHRKSRDKTRTAKKTCGPSTGTPPPQNTMAAEPFSPMAAAFHGQKASPVAWDGADPAAAKQLDPAVEIEVRIHLTLPVFG